MTERHIVAMGGGQRPDDPIYRFLFGLTGASRPRVLFVPTATGDSDRGIVSFYRRFPAHSFEPADLSLFERTVEDLTAFVGAQDVVLVQGGNTANMLSIWRTHGLDVALRRAWEAGVVLVGGSAGANCWFEASTTDSFLMGRADALADGLGLVGGSFCPHYDSEPARRPEFRRLVAEGLLPDGYACDDLAAAHVVDDEIAEFLASDESAAAYRVAADGNGGSTQYPQAVRQLGTTS